MLSVIWNITGRCIWDCAFCVMDAGMGCSRAELSYAEKQTAIEHLRGVDCRVDLSGGEVMLDREGHLPLIAKLSHMLGKDNLGISCSGVNIGEEEAGFLARFVSEVEMTMDARPGCSFPQRPKGYHTVAGKATDLLVANGVRVGLQTVLTRVHYGDPGLLVGLYDWLAAHGVSVWSLLRFFPTGRGAAYPELALSEKENRLLVDRAKLLCRSGGGPKLDVHYLLPGTDKDEHCRCVRKSIGVLPGGDVTSCFWGLDGSGDIAGSRFLLGNIARTPLAEILEGENARRWARYYGCCPLGDDGGDGDYDVFAA